MVNCLHSNDGRLLIAAAIRVTHPTHFLSPARRGRGILVAQATTVRRLASRFLVGAKTQKNCLVNFFEILKSHS